MSDEPLKFALRAYAEASKGEKCPICAGTESCDHTVKERLSAELINIQNSQMSKPYGYVFGGCTFLRNGSPLVTDYVINHSTKVFLQPASRALNANPEQTEHVDTDVLENSASLNTSRTDGRGE